MNADQVRAIVNAKYPNAMKSPLAQMFAQTIVNDEADQATDFASLQARASAAQIRSDAVAHAESCLNACGGWEIESLGFNIECNFDGLDAEECDDIAEAVMRKHGLL
jgi:hypothetical protein